MNKGYLLAIQMNSVAANDPCEICGDRTDPEIGPELFLAGTYGLVCYDCGDKYAPELVELLGHRKIDEGGYWNEDGFWVFSRQPETAPTTPHLRPVPEDYPF
jgi:hypothetical protein